MPEGERLSTGTIIARVQTFNALFTGILTARFARCQHVFSLISQ